MTSTGAPPQRLAYIALGSNLEDPVAQVRAGIAALHALPDTRVDRCSSLYRTAPIGPIPQPDYINAVCRIATSLAAETLMQHLLDIETRRGRVRSGKKWGPRTLDLDLLMYDRLVIKTPGLVLPHPRLHERAFVLYPLAELDPELIIPEHGRVVELMQACPEQRIEQIEC